MLVKKTDGVKKFVYRNAHTETTTPKVQTLFTANAPHVGITSKCLKRIYFFCISSTTMNNEINYFSAVSTLFSPSKCHNFRMTLR